MVHINTFVSHDEKANRHLQVVYAKQTQERQSFMQDLKSYRIRYARKLMRNVFKNIGPKWYQVLSSPQRQALDTLDFCIYQDILENRPKRTFEIIRRMGIFPRPNGKDLLYCVQKGANDSKQMFAELFQMQYGHSINEKRSFYDLNARLMLTSIFYLGYKNLKEMLTDRFQPDSNPEEKQPKKPRVNKKELKSPYLQTFKAPLYYPQEPKLPTKPPPLPNLEALNDAVEETVVYRPPPPPPPPPPIKNTLPRSYCDQIAGVNEIEPYKAAALVKTYKRSTIKKLRSGKSYEAIQVKKTYGIGITRQGKKKIRPPKVPSTGLWNAQYQINGIYIIRGKRYFVLANVAILPPKGELIHGGFKSLEGNNTNIHCGFRGIVEPPPKGSCDCEEKWHDPIFEYLKTAKCHCGHHYDYRNEGTFPPDELPYFEKPSKQSGYKFNYDTIFNTNQKSLQVDKEFKKLWDTDSVLRVQDEEARREAEEKARRIKLAASRVCLGPKPTPQNYLKCALRLMTKVNIAALLPDVHLVPELKEWMRRRIYGPLTLKQKRAKLLKSGIYFQFFSSLSLKNYGHIEPEKVKEFLVSSDWTKKQDLNNKFKKFTSNYILQLFKSYAKQNNMLWPAMFHPQFPDKKFREIYFTYLADRPETIHIIHPYMTYEAVERQLTMQKRAYRCLPKGAEDIQNR